MNFTSLDDALSKNFIKSLPHLTRLDLSANEIKLVELVLSFTRNGNQFYMNYADIAEYLHLGDTKNKAKSVGNIVLKTKAKGYLITDTTHNFNGKNGGSSANLKVDEVFLEKQLHAFFNPVVSLVAEKRINPSGEAKPAKASVVPRLKTSLEKSPSDKPKGVENRDENCGVDYDELVSSSDKSKKVTDNTNAMSYKSIVTLPEFEAMLKRLIRKDTMSSKKSAIQYMIDNKNGWEIDEMKQAFEALILTNLIE